MQSSMVKFHALGEGFVLQNVIVAASHTILRHMYSINICMHASSQFIIQTIHGPNNQILQYTSIRKN